MVRVPGPIAPPVQPGVPKFSSVARQVAAKLVNQHQINPQLALATAMKADLQQKFPEHPAFQNLKQAQAPPVSRGGGVTGPYIPPGGRNPYTGKPLGANEYVGVAGSEADHPGMVRIPPPGWDNPDSPFYERRDYWIGPNGEIIANEPGFQASPDRPYDTGRPGERNAEFANRPGYQHIAMSQPGVTLYGPGGTDPAPNPWQAPSNMQGLPPWLVQYFEWLKGQGRA